LDEVILKAIPAPRADVSQYAPKIVKIKINPDKNAEVIGQRGKTIKRIIEETNVKIDIEEDGTIFVSDVNMDNVQRAIDIILAIVTDPEPGRIYMGKVTRLMNFGAFVEIAPEKEGLVHISKLAHERVNNVEDVVKIGDQIMVKVLEIDEKGRINLSRKDALPKPEVKED
jgi:polyribonucleotide nucleotidyltransferase